MIPFHHEGYDYFDFDVDFVAEMDDRKEVHERLVDNFDCNLNYSEDSSSDYSPDVPPYSTYQSTKPKTPHHPH